jgi:acyl-CoA thioester hydrolase
MTAPAFIHSHRVTYSECTVGDHVYHARYLDMLEEARGEFCRAAGVSLLDLQARDMIFPVIECHLKYLAPARYDDVLAIEVRLTELSRVRLAFTHRVTNQSGALLLEATTFHACTGLPGKPRRIAPEVVEKIRAFQP